MKRLLSTRRRVVIAAVVSALVVCGSAAAAWVVFTGGTGTGKGNFGTSSSGGAAVTFADGSGAPTNFCVPGGACDLLVTETNNAGVIESVTGGTATFTSTPSDCASHLSVNPSAFPISVPATASGSGAKLTNLVKVDSGLPADCSAGTFEATLTLTTSP